MQNLILNLFFVGSYEDAVQYLDTHRPDLIICDYYLPNLKNGFELWEKTRITHYGIPFILMSGMGTQQYIELVKNEKTCPTFLSKPFNIKHLQGMVNEYLKSSTQRRAA